MPISAVGLAVSERAGDSGRALSYIDPRVIELYESGITIAPALHDLGRDTEFGELATRPARPRRPARVCTGRPIVPAAALGRHGFVRAPRGGNVVITVERPAAVFGALGWHGMVPLAGHVRSRRETSR